MSPHRDSNVRRCAWCSRIGEYIASAPIDYVFPIADGEHPRRFGIALVGGVLLYVKPVSEIRYADPVQAIRNEVAAWELAKLLGWADLIAATALREVVNPYTDERELSAVQVMWQSFESCPSLDRLSDHDSWRAAIFDHLIAQEDRGLRSPRSDANNWLGVPAAAARPRLKLIDHTAAFGSWAPPSSAFVRQWEGLVIPDRYSIAAANCLQRLPGSPLTELLGERAFGALCDRLKRLVDAGTILDRRAI